MSRKTLSLSIQIKISKGPTTADVWTSQVAKRKLYLVMAALLQCVHVVSWFTNTNTLWQSCSIGWIFPAMRIFFFTEELGSLFLYYFFPHSLFILQVFLVTRSPTRVFFFFPFMICQALKQRVTICRLLHPPNWVKQRVETLQKEEQQFQEEKNKLLNVFHTADIFSPNTHPPPPSPQLSLPPLNWPLIAFLSASASVPSWGLTSLPPHLISSF